jgi:ADP-ribose pyrophosphatase YjhB (NUDIX family)
MKNNSICPTGTQIQSVIFSKENFTEKQAKGWADHNDFKYGKVDETEHKFRLRQKDPSNFKKGSFRTIELTDGVKAVIGCPVGSNNTIKKPKFKTGGSVRFLNEDDKYRTSWGRKGEMDGAKAVGGFDIRIDGRIHDYYLWELSDFDKDYYSHLELKDGEKLYRYETETTKSAGMFPLVKVNVKKGLIYFIKDLYSNDDKNIIFESRGIKPMWISLSETEKLESGGAFKNTNKNWDSFDNGGEVQFIEYKGQEIMLEPQSKKYYTNDEEFDSLESAQKYIDDGSKPSQKTIDAYKHGAFANGGGVGRTWDEATRKKEQLEYQDYVLRQPNKERDESWYDKTRKIKEEIISINSKIDTLKKEYFEGKEGESELSKAIKFLNDIGINTRWNGRKGESHGASWWLEDAKTESTYIGNIDAEKLIEFAENEQKNYKGLSVEQIRAKRELKRKQEEIAKAREDSDENKWIIKYVSTDDDDVASVWVYAESREEAIENAEEDNWDIGEIISIEKFNNGGGVGNELENKDQYKYYDKKGFPHRHTAEEVFNSWSVKQWRHFCHDHDIPSQYQTRHQFKDFPEYIQNKIKLHVEMGQYDNGGGVGEDKLKKLEQERDLYAVGSGQYQQYDNAIRALKKQSENIKIANEIVKQLGGMGRLNIMTGAYNFIALENGVSFRIKNPKANYIKITLTSMDLYDLEVGRIRGDKYTVVDKKEGLYNDMLKPAIEKATGMYLSLAEGGGVGDNEEALNKMIEKAGNEVAYYKERKNDLENNRVRPNRIIGTGYKPQYARKLAFEWLNEQILKHEEDLSFKRDLLKSLKEGKNVILYDLDGKGVIREVEEDGYVTVYYINGLHSAYKKETLDKIKTEKTNAVPEQVIEKQAEPSPTAEPTRTEIEEAIEYLKIISDSEPENESYKESIKSLKESLNKFPKESFADLNNPQNINGFIYKPTGDLIRHSIYQDFNINYDDNNKISSIELWGMEKGEMYKIKTWNSDVIGSVFSGDNEVEMFEQGAEVLVGGKADGMSLDDIAEMHSVSIDHILRQANIGKKVEREHTSDYRKIIEIVKDHLYESPDYYTKLQAIESSFEFGGGVGGYWIDVPFEHNNNFYTMQLMDIKGTNNGVAQDSGNYRYTYTNERDLDKAIAILNKLKNPNYGRYMPENLNQLKKYLQVGKILRVSYNKNRPDWIGNIKTVSKSQSNGVYLKDGILLNQPSYKLSWFEYPKAEFIQFSPFGFTIYVPDRNNPSNQIKLLGYEYVTGEQEEIAKSVEQDDTLLFNESVKMREFIDKVYTIADSISFDNGGSLTPDMFNNGMEYNLDKESVSCFINAKNTGRTLLLHRTGNDYGGTWSLISGGMESGEGSDETIKREIQEELGVNLNYDNLIFMTATKHPDKTHYYYELTVNEEFEPTLNHENDAYIWVNMSDLPSNMHPLLIKFIKSEVFA